MSYRFQLAALQVSFLCEMGTENDVRNSLNILPDTLTAAYDEIHKRINAQKGSAPWLALAVFRWIKFAYEPISSRTLLDAVTMQVDSSGELSQDGTVTPNTVLRICQNLVILDERLDVFRFAHLSVDEYLEKKLLDVDSHIYLVEICFSLLCTPHHWVKYHETLKTMPGEYKTRHLLLYATVFWPWHFSHCEGSDSSVYILAERFLSRINYQRWLRYHRTVVRAYSWSFDPFWHKVNTFARHKADNPIISACIFGLSETLKVFLKSQVKDVDLDVLLPEACNFGYYEVVRLLIEKGTNVSRAGIGGFTPLHYAALVGHVAIGTLLLDCGANMEAKEHNGCTALHIASKEGDEGIIRLLLNHGANTEVSRNDGKTALHLSVQYGHEVTTRLLLDRGANIEVMSSNCETALHLSVWCGSESMVQLLLDYGAEIEAADNDGHTALHMAVWEERITRLLLDRGASVEAKDYNGRTALHIASEEGNEGITRLLLDYGANSEVSRNDGKTALDLSVQYGHEATAQLLFDRGVDTIMALYLAAKYGHENIIELLLGLGLDIELPGGYYGSPLQAATLSGHRDIVKRLLVAGGSVLSMDSHRWTPLYCASLSRDSSICELLLEYTNSLPVPTVNENPQRWSDIHKHSSLRLANGGLDIICREAYFSY